MKTAEEWQQHWQSITQHWIAQECWDKEDYANNLVSILKEVQLDAMKEGARRAAYEGCKHANVVAHNSAEANVILAYQSAILTTAESWTEKDPMRNDTKCDCESLSGKMHRTDCALNIPKTMTFQVGKRYLCWNTDSISWGLRKKQSEELRELKVLAISSTGSIKFKDMITGYTFWNSNNHPYKIKEQL